MEKCCSFETFKSNVCHQLKALGDIDFLIEMLEADTIRVYYEDGCNLECLYLLAMTDYISRENNISICSDYDDLRKLKLREPIYPASVIALCVASKREAAKQRAYNEAIPEFLRFNIIEGDVRDVI